MAFSLNSYPIIYRSKYSAKKWTGGYEEKPHKKPEEEAALSEAEQSALSDSRNLYADMPLVNYTTQYGLGCFEGIKALPQKDGGLAIFRPDRNAARFFASMKGLYMPPFPEDEFIKACVETVKRNAQLGFRPYYKQEWEKDSFISADSVYIRPFTYAEGGGGGEYQSRALGCGDQYPGKFLFCRGEFRRGGCRADPGDPKGYGLD